MFLNGLGSLGVKGMANNGADPLMIVGLISFLAALIASLTVQMFFMAQRRKSRRQLERIPQDVMRKYVFRENYLISEVESPDWYLTDPEDRSGAWRNLAMGLEHLHPDIRRKMDRLARHGEGFLLVGRLGQDEISLSGTFEDGQVCITVSPMTQSGQRSIVDHDSFERLQEETKILRYAMEANPFPIWRLDGEGNITWANAAYFDLLSKLRGETEVVLWPIPDIFAAAMAEAQSGAQKARISLTPEQPPSGGTGPDGKLWYEVQMHQSASTADHADAKGDTRETADFEGALYIATPCNRLVAAERSLRNFVQTLSKTFAHLPIGLAVFDRKRELILFNPALVDLSTLDPRWLSARPSLFEFLDQLRDNRRMPEPRDYRAWRSSLIALEKGAENGNYEEIWNLPDGQSFRVIGRPHPDGAVALIFENISAEVSLTRKFRGDIEIYQSALDHDEQAVVIFNADGELEISNAAYAVLWEDDPRERLTRDDFGHALQTWEAHCLPHPLFEDLRLTFNGETGAANSAMSDVIWMKDGRRLDFIMTPLQHGRVMLKFRMGIGAGLNAGLSTGLSTGLNQAKPLHPEEMSGEARPNTPIAVLMNYAASQS